MIYIPYAWWTLCSIGKNWIKFIRKLKHHTYTPVLGWRIAGKRSTQRSRMREREKERKCMGSTPWERKCVLPSKVLCMCKRVSGCTYVETTRRVTHVRSQVFYFKPWDSLKGMLAQRVTRVFHRRIWMKNRIRDSMGTPLLLLCFLIRSNVT